MDSYYTLIHKKNQLPKGNIYKKHIKNSFYYYHQYIDNGKRITKLVSFDEAKLIQEQIKDRIEIEKQIKDIFKKGNKNLTLSKNAKEFTGYIMAENKIVAEFEKGQLLYCDNMLAPIVIKRTGSIEKFLKSRAIDAGRTNSRLLKKILHINTNDSLLTSLCSYGATITDNYWFKPKHSKLKYSDVNFNNDMFFNTALKGLITIYPNKILLTPELTTNGGYEKGWKNIDGEWWLYKAGTKEEIFSELFYSRLFEKLELPTAHYEDELPYIKTKNFTTSYNFEPMISLVDENEDISFIYNTLNNINHKIALDYLRLCAFDVILNNVDRHNENCGILRDKNNGKIISLAPNYDDNLCLISRDKNLNTSNNEGFLKLFIKIFKTNKEIKNAYKEVAFPTITSDILDNIFKEISIEVDIDKELIKKFILNRFNKIIFEINN